MDSAKLFEGAKLTTSPVPTAVSQRRHRGELGSAEPNDRGSTMLKASQTTTSMLSSHQDPALQLFKRQLQRYGGEGDCAYERALSQLYRQLFEQRCSQLDALRRAGL